jgi:hypothetical protein
MSDTPARSVSSRRDLPARASLEHLRNESEGASPLCARVEDPNLT